MNDVRVCRVDNEPLVFTFEFPGFEYVCAACDGKEDIFGARVLSTPELLLRHTELKERYDRARAEREGRPYVAPAHAGEEGVQLPTCGGCGATPPDGVALVGGKPSSWFSRTVDGVTSYACSRACIPEREAVLPW